MKFNLPIPQITMPKTDVTKLKGIEQSIWTVYAGLLEIGTIEKKVTYNRDLKRYETEQYDLIMSFNNINYHAWITVANQGTAMRALSTAKFEARYCFTEDVQKQPVETLHVLTRTDFTSRYHNGYKLYTTLNLDLERHAAHLYNFANSIFNGPVSAIDSRAIVVDGYGRDITLPLALVYGKALNTRRNYINFDALETEVNKR